MALSLIESAKGIDNTPVVSEEWIPKGIGNEITLPKDNDDEEELLEHLRALTENVTLRLRKQKKYAYTVCVTMKTKDFKRKSHQKKLKNATNSTDEIYRVVKEVFLEMNFSEGIRLIGVRLDNLTNVKTVQGTLFEHLEEKENSSKLDEIVDTLKSKYGMKVIKKASLLTHQEFKNLKD